MTPLELRQQYSTVGELGVLTSVYSNGESSLAIVDSG